MRSKSNVELKVQMRDGDALITRARANLMTLFLDDPTATHFLFVDADIGFEPEQVFRLIESGADVVAGVYPIKRVNWDKARRVIENRRPNVPSAALDYVLEIDDPDHVAVVNGFTRVRYAGTGFLMIRRHVFEKMCAHPAYASLQFFREHSLDALAGSPNRFALFECMIDPATGTYLSEDFAFCKRWTDIGGEIWADLESRLDHVGPSVFHGDVSSQFAAPAACDRCCVRWNRFARPQMRLGPLACADRIGLARLAKMAFTGTDLRPLWRTLIAKLIDGSAEAGEGLDLSLIAQLLGDKQAGLAIQHEIPRVPSIISFALRGSESAAARSGACGGDRHGQQHADRVSAGKSGIELMTLYVIPDVELPAPLPDHDIAIVIASDSEDCREALRKIDHAAPHWTRPLLNPPRAGR